MLRSTWGVLSLCLGLVACGTPGDEQAARRWLTENGYEVTLITQAEPGEFQYAAVQGERRCRGTIKVSTSAFGGDSHSHFNQCTDGASDAELAAECASGRLISCQGLGLRQMDADPEAALAVFDKACTGGVAASCTNAGVLNARKNNGPEAVRFARMACAGEDPIGCDNLGTYLLTGLQGPITEADKAEGARLLEAGCARGNQVPCGRLGWELSFGDNLPRDEARARVLFTSACEAEQWGPCGDLGILWRDGRGGPRDLAQAIGYLGRSCTGNGSALGCRLHGQLLAEQGNNAGALASYQRGCQSEEPDAQRVGDACNFVGVHIFERGTPDQQAIMLAALQRACDGRNHADACHNLGIFHRGSRFGPANPQLQAQYMQRACSLGHRTACGGR